ncbi:hypothetical protein [Propioniciclava flava]
MGDTLRTGLVRARVHAGLGRLRGADAALAATATLLAERQAGQSDLETRTALAVHGRPAARPRRDARARRRRRPGPLPGQRALA